MNNNNYWTKRIASFKYAFNGIRLLFKHTPNAILELIIALIAILLGFLLKITGIEWVAICILIGLVFGLEAVNTAIETLSNYSCKNEFNRNIKNVKDLAAGAVLIAAIVSVIVGIIIFLPKIICLF
ncbi:MAG: diacylglycerol kinase family protein [Dysgonamonadaceae bacterium]|nr:diacylglycerol kinase family protein [Dysgonamonadaceae bacterium]MDD4397953.1 diacylglycerol kinase family protein [Dysgonamonadaceae bacterium]